MVDLTENLNYGMVAPLDAARCYQASLVEIAKRYNSIICLPTGTGKTYIALSLMQHYYGQCLNDGKKIIFLANTIQLLMQQKEYFEKGFRNENAVVMMTGFQKPSFCQKHKWRQKISQHDIFCMTSQMFLEILTRSILQWNDICLIVLDECHHAVKNHPMALVMRQYCQFKMNNPKTARVLGLTATIIKGAAKLEKMQEDLKAVQSRFQSVAVTYHDYSKVLNHSSTCKVEMIGFEEHSNLGVTTGFHVYFNRSIDFLSSLKKSIFCKLDYLVKITNHDTLKRKCQLYNMEVSYEKSFIKHFKEVKIVLEQYGTYFAWVYAHLLKNYILDEYTALSLYACENELINVSYKKKKKIGANIIENCSVAERKTFLLELLLSNLDFMIQTFDLNYGYYSLKQKLLDSCSSKIAALADLLLKQKPKQSEKEEFCTIVFCRKRLTALMLSYFFKDLSANSVDFRFLKCGYVVGLGMREDTIFGIQQSAETHRSTITDFRNGKLNVLFATSVLEEGLDVPRCSIIIRFDPVTTYASYIQSKGRARLKGAKYFALVENRTMKNEMSKYALYENYNTKLSDYLISNAHEVDDVNLEFVDEKDAIPPFAPFGPSGPMITSHSAINIIMRYCQLLSIDLHILLTPISWWTEVEGSHPYKAYLKLPLNAHYTKAIEGDPQTSKGLAKKSVFLNACKILYEKKALDDDLSPLKKMHIPSCMEKFVEASVSEKVSEGVFSNAAFSTYAEPESKMTWYQKMLPKVLRENIVLPKKRLMLYEITMRNISVRSLNAKLYNDDEFPNRIGILADEAIKPFFKEMQMQPVILHARGGDVEANINGIRDVTLTDAEYQNLMAYQQKLYNKIIKLELIHVEKNPNPYALIVPLLKVYGHSSKIDWDSVTKLAHVEFSSILRESKLYSAEEYEDAVIVPTYRNSQGHNPPLFVVIKVEHDLGPASKFENESYSCYEEYFRKAYNATVTRMDQPLVACIELGSNLNFLNSRTPHSNKVKDKRTLRLIPELCGLVPCKGSFLAKLLLMPSYLQKLCRLFMTMEIRQSVFDCSNIAVTQSTAVSQDPVFAASTTPFIFSLREEFKSKKNNQKGNEAAIPAVAADASTNEGRIGDLEHLSSKFNGLLKTTETQLLTIERGTPESSCLNNTLSSYPCWNYDALIKVSEKLENLINPKKLKVDSSGLHISNQDESILSNSEKEFNISKKASHFALDASLNKRAYPGLFDLYASITLAKAFDDCSLERFEILGDSVLKYLVTTHIFLEFPDFREGQLTELRNKLVSNEYLQVFGNRRELGHILAGGVFDPVDTWLPPSCSVNPFVCQAVMELKKNYHFFKDLPLEQRYDYNGMLKWAEEMNGGGVPNRKDSSYTHTLLKGKDVADCVEALIGVYFHHGGLDGASQFLEWMNILGPVADKKHKPYKKRVNDPSLDRFKVSDELKKSPEDILPEYRSVEEALGYKFKNPWLIVEALTHPCYTENDITPCYQKLEFLGDAVLDFLVTLYIYYEKEEQAKTPGKLTDLRAAIVNNVTFGSLAVRYRFHQNILYISSTLNKAIEKFASVQTKNSGTISGQFELLTDFDAPRAVDVEVPKILGDVFESLIGAIFVDCKFSLEETWKIVFPLMKDEMDSLANDIPVSPVRAVYELGGKFLSDIADISSNEVPHMGFTHGYVAVKLIMPSHPNGIVGIGKSRGSAKLAAAKYAMLLHKSATPAVSKTMLFRK